MSENYQPGMDREPDEEMDEERQEETREEQEKQHQGISFRLIQGNPYATWTLLATTVLVYLLQVLSKWRYGVDYPLIYGAKVSAYITYGHQYWRLITPIFLHASVPHILFNMYALFTLGPALEKYYGHVNFLRFYLICGFAGNVVSHVFSKNSLSVGASTAIFGLIAAQAMFFLKNRRLLRNYRAALQNIGLVIVVNLLLGLRGGIDNWGHLGGLLCGLLLSWLVGPEFALIYKGENEMPELTDTIPQTRREISFILVTLFFAAMAYAL